MELARSSMLSTPEVIDEPEEERETDAENEAGDDWEIEGRAFAAIDDVAREFSQAKWKSSPEIQDGATDNQHGT
jgi:hypothetical protein